MSTHGGNDMEISTVIRVLNSVGERAEPRGEPVVSGCVRFYPLKCNFNFSIV